MRNGLNFIVVGGWMLVSGMLHAQGMLPGAPTALSTSTVAMQRLIIGERLPETLQVVDKSGHDRLLMSFKSPLDVLVIFYLSAGCDPALADWAGVRRFYGKFKEWRVSFVALAGTLEEARALGGVLARERLESIAVAHDPSGMTRRVLAPPGAPSVLFLDEIGYLRFRGPLGSPGLRDYTGRTRARRDAEHALDTLLGQLDPIAVPEPNDPPACPLP